MLSSLINAGLAQQFFSAVPLNPALKEKIKTALGFVPITNPFFDVAQKAVKALEAGEYSTLADVLAEPGVKDALTEHFGKTAEEKAIEIAMCPNCGITFEP